MTSGTSALRIGAHVDQQDPIAEVQAREANVAQLSRGDPQGWTGPMVASFQPSHPRINVQRSNNRIRIPSRKLLQQQVDAAAEIGAKGLIVHGGHVLKDDDPEVGYDNWRKCIERTELRCRLLIENTAGGDKAMTRRLDSIARVWEAIAGAEGADQVGFCLDTCHAHASGEELSDLVERICGITGQVDLVHANDSRDAFGSGADRHTNLGDGQIDLDMLIGIARSARAPVVVETPGPGQADDIALLRKHLS